MTEREKQLMAEAEKAVQVNKDIVNADSNRLHYHVMPPVGLLNDPNGLIHFNGLYHLFFQWNPFATQHGAKFWGHYTSADLVHWKLEPIALAPSEWFEKNGCYSGSAIEKDGNMVLFYTGNVKDENDIRETYQCMAVSTDGFSFEKKGPVLHLPEGYTAHFRDPKVWEQDGKWYMVVGAQDLQLKGKVVLYSSEDLENWTFHGPIAGSNLNGLGDFGYMWECPDLFRLDGADVLVASPQGLQAEGILYNNIYQTGYLVGSFDESGFEHGAFTELDRGFDFYAPQTLLDEAGRRILIGWMGVPEENEDDHPTIAHHWIHCMTLPRVLSVKDGTLYQTPVEELKNLRLNDGVQFENRTISSGLSIEGAAAVELRMDSIKGDFDRFEITFGNACKFRYNAGSKLATLERNSFGKVETRSCVLESLQRLHVFKDTSSIELFLNDGQEVFSARVFSSTEDHSIHITADGDMTINLEKWELKNIWK